MLESNDDTLLLLHTLQQGDYMREFKHAEYPTCIEYTKEEIFNWNFWLWTASYLLLGVQFTNFDVGPMKHFTCTKASMLKWGPAFWALFVGVVVTIGYLVYLDF